jgi:hypothetical protein
MNILFILCQVFTKTLKTFLDLKQVNIPLFCSEHYFMIVKVFFGTQIINASFLFANSNISVKYYSKDFPSVKV